MPLPSKFLKAGARSAASLRGFPPLFSSRANSLTFSSAPSTSVLHLQTLSRLYSTPVASDLNAGPNLLDQAPDLEAAFSLPPPPTAPLPPPEIDVSSLAELGLGGYWPPGLTQEGLNFLHSLGLPWWSCIVLGACIVRPLMLPLFAAVQRNAVNMLNHGPELQQFQMKILAAHSVGDRVATLRIGSEQRAFMKEKDISHLRQLRLMAFQGVIFISMFVGLRGMAQYPIESFKTEGLLHIVDLTASDPYFVLPTITSLTMFIILRTGAEGVHMDDFPPWIKWGMTYGLPMVVFIPVAFFPSALGIYWVTSNFISLGQAMLFRSDFGKKLFRIPEKQHNPKGWGMGLDKVSFGEQMAKMQQVAQEAARTQAKLKSFELPDDRARIEGLKKDDDSSPKMVSLTPEEVAARHSDIKKMIKEINEMKKKVEDLQPDVKKMENQSKPPDIHIKIPKDKIE